ncbi:MAG: hypothetical protein AAGB12_09555 [Pseudomonadota bacterium]
MLTIKKYFIFTALIFSLFLSQVVMAWTKVSNSITMNGQNFSADWYLPDNQARGLVYLQHGFQADKNNVSQLAEVYVSADIMVLAIDASMTGGNPSLAVTVADTFANQAITPPNGFPLPTRWVFAGHSAGGLHATLIAAELVQLGQSVAGLVLFDPVDASSLMQTATARLQTAQVPYYGILANGGLCNSFNNSQGFFESIPNQTFGGFKLVDGSTHLDAYGTESYWYQSLFCGSPSTQNINYLREFSLEWVKSLLNVSTDSDYFPGGEIFEQIINVGDAVILQ